MHSAKSRPEVLALYRHVKPEDLRTASLGRLFELWAYREEKMKSGETYLREIERAKVWLEEQAQRWEQVATQRQEAMVASEETKALLEQQVRNWQGVADQRKRALAAYEASEVQLEEQLRNLQQTAEEQRQRIAELEEARLRLQNHLITGVPPPHSKVNESPFWKKRLRKCGPPGPGEARNGRSECCGDLGDLSRHHFGGISPAGLFKRQEPFAGNEAGFGRRRGPRYMGCALRRRLTTSGPTRTSRGRAFRHGFTIYSVDTSRIATLRRVSIRLTIVRATRMCAMRG